MTERERRVVATRRKDHERYIEHADRLLAAIDRREEDAQTIEAQIRGKRRELDLLRHLR